MVKVLLGLTLFFPFILQAQFAYQLDQSIKVENADGVVLTAPWVGGLNAAQYNTIDLNNDSVDDLVIFDRMAQKVLTFLSVNNEYIYTPEYEIMFPDKITNWLLLRDFNCDGKKDIFTGDILGMRVFRNVSDQESIKWEPYFFYIAPNIAKSEVLLSQGLSGLVNVQMQFDDLPAISDLDGDGDLDIMCMRFGGSGTVEFHKNMSMETYGTCDSLLLKLITQSWGGFRECDCGLMSFGGKECGPSGGRTEHAGGKSLLALDVNGDASLDLLISEADCNTIAVLQNEGDLDNPVFNDFSFYPFSTPVNAIAYPGAYFEDVDFDGRKDLMVTPSIFSKEPININLSQSNWFYKNVGSNAVPDFVFMKNNFLQEHMLDIGDNAIPAFADFDGDGDYDLFISTNNVPATIHLYENVGTASAPAFKFLTADYANFARLPLRNLKIQFVDVNADRKTDLVFTATSYQNGITGLYYILNKGDVRYDFSNQSIQSIDFPMVSLENIFITDIDNDGKLDILKGKNNGTLEFWKNNGSLSFTLQTPQFLNITPDVFRPNLAVTDGDLDGDGKLDLILADQSGKLRIVSDYKNVSSIAGAVSDIIFNNLTTSYYDANLGGRIWPTISNLYGSIKPAIIVGTALGGLRILKNSSTGENENIVIHLFPNPKKYFETLKALVNRPASVQLFSSNGQTLIESFPLRSNQVSELPLGTLAAGIYILRFQIDNKFYSRRFVVH